MFSVHCPRHGHEVLLGHRQIQAIEGSGDDLVVRWVCWCGHQGTLHSVGTATAGSQSPSVAAVA